MLWTIPMVAILVDSVMFDGMQGACWAISAWSLGTRFFTLLPCKLADLHVRLDLHVMLYKGPACKNTCSTATERERFKNKSENKGGFEGEVEFSESR